MTLNVHILLHLVDSVRMSGPLWATSAFPSENGVFYLKKQVTGPKGIYNQIAKRMLLRNSYKLLIEKTAQSEKCVKFCKSLFSKEQCVLSAEIISTADTNVVLLGLRASQSCIYKGKLLCSTQYARAKGTNDTMVKLKNNDIVSIRNFILTADNSVHLNVEVMNIVDVIHYSMLDTFRKSRKQKKRKLFLFRKLYPNYYE